MEIADFRRRTMGQFGREIESAFPPWMNLEFGGLARHVAWDGGDHLVG